VSAERKFPCSPNAETRKESPVPPQPPPKTAPSRTIANKQKKNSPNLLNQLVLGQRSLLEFDLVALALQDILASLVDIFQEQDLDILSVEGLEMLGRCPVR